MARAALPQGSLPGRDSEHPAPAGHWRDSGRSLALAALVMAPEPLYY